MAAYYITGISGTGKSTVASELKKDGYVVYDIDAVEGLCHWRNKKTKIKARYFTGVGKDWLELHEWICDVEKLRNLIENLPLVIVVGVASNQREFLKYFDKIFLLHCSEQTFLNRINNREGDNQFAKDVSEQQHILSWSKDFHKEMVEIGAIPINTEESLENVVLKIKGEISNNPL